MCVQGTGCGTRFPTPGPCRRRGREWSNNSIAALVRAVGLRSAWPVTGRTARLGGRTSQSTGAGSRSEPAGAPHDSRGTATVGSRGVAIVVLQHATAKPRRGARGRRFYAVAGALVQPVEQFEKVVPPLVRPRHLGGDGLQG